MLQRYRKEPGERIRRKTGGHGLDLIAHRGEVDPMAIDIRHKRVRRSRGRPGGHPDRPWRAGRSRLYPDQSHSSTARTNWPKRSARRQEPACLSAPHLGSGRCRMGGRLRKRLRSGAATVGPSWSSEQADCSLRPLGHRDVPGRARMPLGPLRGGPGLPAATTSASPELSDRPRRRTFTARDKMRILAETDRVAETGGIGAILRREGVYSSSLTNALQRDAGAFGALAQPSAAQAAAVMRLSGAIAKTPEASAATSSIGKTRITTIAASV